MSPQTLLTEIRNVCPSSSIINILSIDSLKTSIERLKKNTVLGITNLGFPDLWFKIIWYRYSLFYGYPKERRKIVYVRESFIVKQFTDFQANIVDRQIATSKKCIKFLPTIHQQNSIHRTFRLRTEWHFFLYIRPYFNVIYPNSDIGKCLSKINSYTSFSY